MLEGVYMILIDETKISKDILARILEAQGIDIGKYVKKVYSEEEIEAIANNLRKCNRKYDNDDFIEEFKESLRVAEYIDYDKLLEEYLPLYQVKVGTYEGIDINNDKVIAELYVREGKYKS